MKQTATKFMLYFEYFIFPIKKNHFLYFKVIFIYNSQRKIAENMAEAIYEKTGKKFTYGTPPELLCEFSTWVKQLGSQPTADVCI